MMFYTIVLNTGALAILNKNQVKKKRYQRTEEVTSILHKC